jgi:hypothetical protein
MPKGKLQQAVTTQPGEKRSGPIARTYFDLERLLLRLTGLLMDFFDFMESASAFRISWRRADSTTFDRRSPRAMRLT